MFSLPAFYSRCHVNELISIDMECWELGEFKENGNLEEMTEENPAAYKRTLCCAVVRKQEGIHFCGM